MYRIFVSEKADREELWSDCVRTVEPCTTHTQAWPKGVVYIRLEYLKNCDVHVEHVEN